ncbi:MAG: ABC transporter permease subunit, partial [Turicibacter sp.]
MWDFIVAMMPYALAFTAPMLVTALGGLFSERSGVVNIGLEGLMLVGAFTTAIFINMTYNVYGTESMIWLGILLGAIVAGIFSLFHAYASINLKADQVISGTALNLLAPAITIFLARTLTGSQNINIIKGVSRIDVPI